MKLINSRLFNMLFLTCFYTLCSSLTAEDFTKRLFAGPSAPIHNNYPNGKESPFRSIKFNNKPDLTGFRLDFIDVNGGIGKRNYWYLTAADINGEPVELKGCFKYKIDNNILTIDLYKIDQHKYQSVSVKKRLNLGDDTYSTYSWVHEYNTLVADKNIQKDFNKAAILTIPLTDGLLTKQIIFIDSNLTDLNDVLKSISKYGAPYHLLKQEDCVVGSIRSIPKVANYFNSYFSILENCSYLTMRYMHRELTPHHEDVIIVPPTMYNYK